ncbi:MAG: hypothetical protein WCC98_16745 [Candidatus Acidiferrales bacterium]
MKLTLPQALAHSPAPRSTDAKRTLNTEPVFHSELANAFHSAVKHAVTCGSPLHIRLLMSTIKHSIDVTRHLENELNVLLEICEHHLRLIEHVNTGVREYERRAL